MASIQSVGDKAPAQISMSSSPSGDEMFDGRLGHVGERYRGTTNDVHDMSVLGKKQVLKARLPR